MKKWISLLVCCVLCLSPVCSALCGLFGRVMGFGMLSEEEQKSVTIALDSFEQQTGMRFAVLLLDEEDDLLEDQGAEEEVLRSFCSSMISPNSGVLYCIDLHTGKEHLCATGDMAAILTEEMEQEAHRQVRLLIESNDIAQAICSMVSIAQSWLPQSVVDSQTAKDMEVVGKTDELLALIAEHNQALTRISEKQTDAAVKAASARADLLLSCYSSIQEQITSLLDMQIQIAQMMADLSAQQ